METKSNHVIVGAVTLLLLAIVAGFAVWLSRISDGDKKQYDIFFQQSVNGLAKGSGVSFSGVPVGQIETIELWGPDPDFVRVRISIKDNVPILLGTTATINGVGFTGVSEIQLDGAVKGAPPLSCPVEKPESACPAGVPVIPTKPGALGELLNNAPLLLERLST
ncbi:MAG: MlaD family protein, partial [Sphingorhabdus sp.]